VTFPGGAEFSFWGLLFLYYYSPWVDFSSRVYTHLFNGSLTPGIFYSKYKGYTWRLIPPTTTKTSTKASSFPIIAVVQELLDHISLQVEEPLLVQPKDDVPYTFPTILHPKVVLQGPEIDQSLDIRVHHDPVELRMMEVFQQVDSQSLGSHAFTLVTIEIPCYKSQPTTCSQPKPFSYGFTNKYIKMNFGHMRFHGGCPWKVDFVDLSRRIYHLAAWLHWSFEYDDLIMAGSR
jgi:hypothetical protein